MRLLFLLLLVLASHLPAADPPTRSDWLVFASSDCEECEWLKHECLPALGIRLGRPLPRALLFDFETENNYEVLVAVEEVLDTTGDGVPVLLAGKRLLYGKKAIAEWAEKMTADELAELLPPAILPALAKGKPTLYAGSATPAPIPHVAPAAEPAGDETAAQVLYFRTPGCASCALTSTRLDHLAKRYPGVPVQRITTDERGTRLLQYAIATRLDIPPGKRLVTPMVVSGTHAVYGKSISDAALAQLLAEAPTQPVWQTWDRETALAEAADELDALTHSFTLLTILAVGLADGINPCAFAVIVFLVSYLTLARGGGRRTALIFGLLFTLGVFLCYFLIGLGLTQLLELLQLQRGVVRVIYWVVAALCLVFGILAIWDTCRSRSGKAMQFGMPKSLHRAAHALIRRQVGKGVLGLGTVLLGMMVSALELVCTGQIYLPALILMNQAGRSARSLGLLLAYNVAFVVPLILVVILGAYGVGSKQLAGWGRRHATLTRALTAVVFLALAALLLKLAWRA